MHVCIVVVLIAFGCGFFILWVTDKMVFGKYESYSTPKNDVTESLTMNGEPQAQEVNGFDAEHRDDLTTTGKLLCTNILNCPFCKLF